MNRIRNAIVFGGLAVLDVSCDRAEPVAAAEAPATAKPAAASDWVPDDPELLRGREIYHQTCHLCHEHGEEGAPRLSRREAWEPRVAKGLDVLVPHAIEGFSGSEGTMPPRGGEDSYSDEQIAAAVKFMAAASLRNP